MIKSTTRLIFFTALVSLFIGLSACDKEDDSTPKILLTEKQWKLTSWISKPAYEVEGQLISNVYTLLPVCAHDDFLVFNADETVIKDEGEEKCNEYEPQTTSGTWLFNNDQSILRITFENDETDYVIGEVSDNFLILRRQEVIGSVTGNVTYEYLITYTRM